MERLHKYRWLIIALLIVAGLFIGIGLYVRVHQPHYLKVAFLDIGQGDSIYIEAPNGKQMLIDGGPDATVLSRLSKVMPFGDRSIDIVVATHDDADHIGGLPTVIDHYAVTDLIQNGVLATTETYKSLQTEADKHGLKKIIARRGMRIILDTEKNIYFDILFPDRDVSAMDSNDGSIVGKLTYGTESFMFTGDAPKYTEYLITQNEKPETLHANILKLGHHGSRTASSELWLEAVQPDIAIISAGLHNRYGHPHQETLDRLAALHIPFLATYQLGTIVFQTDGKTMWH